MEPARDKVFKETCRHETCRHKPLLCPLGPHPEAIAATPPRTIRTEYLETLTLLLLANQYHSLAAAMWEQTEPLMSSSKVLTLP